MKKQIAVVALVNGALAIEIIQMRLQHMTFDEVGFEIIDDGLLIVNEIVGRDGVGVDGWEIRIVELI